MKAWIILLFIFVSNVAEAHSRLKLSDVIKIRSTNPGVKSAPCGGYARVVQPANLRGGETITITWEETVFHPGRFEFYFSEAGEKNFTLLKSVENTQKGMPLPHQFTTTLTIPNVNCEACTFQMVQVMAENPSNPTYYYSCADMKVEASGTTMPTPLPGTNPTPTPAPSTGDECPH